VENGSTLQHQLSVLLYIDSTTMLASYPALHTLAFVACSTQVSTASDKCWGAKAWVQGYIPLCSVHCYELNGKSIDNI